MREICYQREMREREAARDPRLPDAAINYTIEEIGADEARQFILRYEWLKTVGRPLARYGARNPTGELAAVALFGTPAATNAANLFGEAPGLFGVPDYREEFGKAHHRFRARRVRALGAPTHRVLVYSTGMHAGGAG